MKLYILGDGENIETLVDAEGKFFIVLTAKFVDRIVNLEYEVKSLKNQLDRLNSG